MTPIRIEVDRAELDKVLGDLPLSLPALLQEVADLRERLDMAMTRQEVFAAYVNSCLALQDDRLKALERGPA